MKSKTILLSFCFLLTCSLCFSQDADGSKEHPMFPNRMPNYLISEYASNFDAVDFTVGPGETKLVTKEGTKTSINYGFDNESGKQMPSILQILRNYETAAKKIGGTTVFLNATDYKLATFMIKKGNSETWVKVEMGPNDAMNFTLTILELEAMKQEITSDDILTALNTDGHISLYINFATGKSDIDPESQKIVDQIAQMLSANPSLKVSVEGHTDNSGTAAGNKTLSENRAKAVMNACVAKGIDKGRLASKGWGLEKPLADNATEEGKAMNRRVEIVKM